MDEGEYECLSEAQDFEIEFDGDQLHGVATRVADSFECDAPLPGPYPLSFVGHRL
jgi:hypothetical protein